MSQKILITISGENVAPRFDMTTEIVIVQLNSDGETTDERTMVLHHSSPEDLCQLIVSKEVRIVVCGGIEEEYHQYLTWKKLVVFDSVVGPYGEVLLRLKDNTLESGLILFERPERTSDSF
jgi:predicted Fe-Mo cluster-binding NifX family protein